MSNNTETNNLDQDINILKSTINNLIQENKQLLESNEQSKIVNTKLRDFIDTRAHELETQIQLILGCSRLLSGHDGLLQQFSESRREDLIQAIYRAALKLHYLIGDMKVDFLRMESQRLKL